MIAQRIRLPLAWLFFARNQLVLSGLLLWPLFGQLESSRGDELVRSVTNIRTLLPDALLAPRQSERVTHRGWEIRRNQFTVVADSEANARRAAEQFERAWEKTLRLADKFHPERPPVGFANNSVLIFVDRFGADQGRQSQNYPVGSQFVVHVVGGAASDDDFGETLDRHVHGASVHAFLHSTHLDQTLPIWTQDGMAKYIAHSFTDQFQEPINDALTNESQRARDRRARPIRGAFPRTATSSDNHDAESDAGAWVQFLLEADGGRFANRFFKSLRQQPTQAIPESLRDDLALSFENWRKQPHPSPAYVPSPYDSDEVRQLEIQLFTLLRLAERWNRAETSPSTVTTNVSAGMKVAEFVAGPQQFVRPEIKPLEQASQDDTLPTSESTAEPESPVVIPIDAIAANLTQSDWCINVPGGGWMTADEADALVQELELDRGRVEVKRTQKIWEVRYQWDDEHHVVGRWEPNDKSPLVRFQLERKPAQPRAETNGGDQTTVTDLNGVKVLESKKAEAK